MARHGPKPTSPSEAINVLIGSWYPPEAYDVNLRDSLILGPCHPNSELHGALRSEYWHSFEQDIATPSTRELRERDEARCGVSTPKLRTAEQLIATLVGFPESLPIVLWVSANPNNRLTFWWMLDALVGAGIPTARCWVGDSRYPGWKPSDVEFANIITPLSRARARQGVSLWAKYASPSPIELDRARLSGTLQAMDTELISALLFWALPRVVDDEDSCPRLSEFDQLLLGHLDDRKWVRPYDVLVSMVIESEWHPAVNHFGDAVFTQRFREWAGHQTEEPSVVGRTVLERGNSLQRIAYRLTPKGRRIVDVGLDDPGEAPEFHVGGCRVYRGMPVWARHIVGSEWRVDRWR